MTDQLESGAPFLIEGKLTNLHWEMGSENLLAKVSKHYKGNAVVTGAGATVGEMFGQVANAAMLAMYDGEDTQNFMCLIDDQVACGQFGGAEQLPEGGTIKAVVSRKDGVLYVHAAMDEARELVWINHPWGTRAEMWANLKLGIFLFLFGMVGVASAVLFLGPKDGDYVGTFLTFGAAIGGLCLIVALWSIKDMNAVAGPSTEYFRLLGFETPQSVNLNGFTTHDAIGDECRKKGVKPPDSWFGESEYHYRNIYSLSAAKAAGKARLISPRQDAA